MCSTLHNVHMCMTLYICVYVNVDACLWFKLIRQLLLYAYYNVFRHVSCVVLVIVQSAVETIRIQLDDVTSVTTDCNAIVSD